jgi:hypothetical protein
MTMEPVDLELPVAVQASGLPAELEIALDRASDFARAEKAPNTRRAYTTDFAAFRAWCAGRGVSALPATAEIVAAFIGAEADRGLKASTIGRRLAAIRYAHKLACLPVPTEVEAVRAVIRGIRRTIGSAKAPKAAATNDLLLAMVAAQKRESQKTKWVSGSQVGYGGASRAYRKFCRGMRWLSGLLHRARVRMLPVS